MAGHSLLSPSSAHRWLKCPGSVALEQGITEARSSFADEGTAAHFLASSCLETEQNAIAYVGCHIEVKNGECSFITLADECFDSTVFEVDQEMIDSVQMYLDRVRMHEGALFVEKRFDLSGITTENNGGGTADAAIISDKHLTIIDLKYGKGVKVDAVHNEQLMMYAAGALLEFELFGIETVELVIVQPRLDHIDSWIIPAETLYSFCEDVKKAAQKALNADFFAEASAGDLVPGEDQCRFCKAKALCPALSEIALTTSTTSINAETEANKLGFYMSQLKLIEAWIKAVRERVYKELESGTDIPGFKLVVGQPGHRKWINEEEVDNKLKSLKVPKDLRYEKVLVSPTQVERLFNAGQLSETQWSSLQNCIVRRDGNLTVVPASDKRQAANLVNTIDFFEDVSIKKG